MAQTIGIATEDALSEAVVEKMLHHATVEFNIVWKQRKQGFGYLKKKVRTFNAIANNYCPASITLSGRRQLGWPVFASA